ncbi:MAG TPA: DUF1801 domain-containing protein [Mycobacteriales bacterium]|jgi:uncharacterized protein YdhG (YjbR/CyaY superfamily)|nr:DUF1801 domain-containing protein [Mycobacteriales bacterium]
MDVDGYISGLGLPQRATLQQMRSRILGLVPQAEQVISYQVPGFRIERTMIAGLAAFTRHLSYLPHSGSVLPAMSEQLAGYTYTKSALHFPLDEPLPTPLIRRLLELRLQQAGLAVPLTEH